ncbi:MAG: peptidylprolyl isomerase [Flavobacteriales bacterium]|nr:MAG: peptidylprolyl isomerase [Flavobacteriales bacterium]
MRFFVYIIISATIISCSGDVEEFRQIDMNQLQEDLLEANKKATTIEAKQIEDYIKRKNLEVVKTQTGLSYQIYNDLEGELITKNQIAAVKYTVSLLDDTECYSTEKGVEEFTVGQDYVESGLHEGIAFMSAGDKAIIIIPSHLAHGLAGDLKKIPFRATIVYDIELVAIK